MLMLTSAQLCVLHIEKLFLYIDKQDIMPHADSLRFDPQRGGTMLN